MNSVSYTHLDVYKRQVQPGLLVLGLGLLDVCLGAGDSGDGLRLGGFRTLNAVSYTHLDVYKRQELLLEDELEEDDELELLEEELEDGALLEESGSWGGKELL